ncbi:MAG: SMP-30/gluconolactonase/LRE family protein [Pirellulales bacterium]|nr:SMP-30/gluconolactonase/LRE family protein [Pirellulales bacterium]
MSDPPVTMQVDSRHSGQRRPPSRVRRMFVAVVLIVALVAVYLALSPSPIDALPYDPPPRPAMTGVLAPNDKLRAADALAAGHLIGPEDVEPDGKGGVYTGLEDGRIVRIDASGKVEEFVNTGGRPLGLRFDAQGKLIVADGVKGLLEIAPNKEIKVLTTKANGQPLGFTDDLDVARDGTIYFSDASTKFGVGEYLYDMLEARPHGRLVSHDRATGETKILLDGLYFANGVALSPEEDFVLVNETYRYRISRYWLKGPQAGRSEIWIDNLPGFPDNLSSNGHGKYWVALFTERNDTLDRLSPRPRIKNIMAKLPKFLWPAPAPYGFVIAVDEQGKIFESLQDPGGQNLKEITSAAERDGYLYLGSLSNDRVGRYRLP